MFETVKDRAGKQNDDAYPITTSVPSTSVTLTREPFVPSEQSVLKEFGVPRANIAADLEHPDGTTDGGYAERNKNATVLQQHVSFWDVDGDGYISILETVSGFRRLGFNFFMCAITVWVNIVFSAVSMGRFDPWFRIKVSRIHSVRHGSGSSTFDNEGRFRPQQFEDIFAKFSSLPQRDGLRYADVLRMLACQTIMLDAFGLTAHFLEWTYLYIMLWPEDGILKKGDVRAMFDGSLFYTVATRVAEERKKKNT